MPGNLGRAISKFVKGDGIPTLRDSVHQAAKPLGRSANSSYARRAYNSSSSSS